MGAFLGKLAIEGQKLAEELAANLGDEDVVVDEPEPEAVEYESEEAKQQAEAAEKDERTKKLEEALAKKKQLEEELMKLDRNAIAQLKMFNQPPPAIHKVLKTALYLLGYKPKE